MRKEDIWKPDSKFQKTYDFFWVEIIPTLVASVSLIKSLAWVVQHVLKAPANLPARATKREY